MALTLSVVDNADDTGATATIAGADSATVTVYSAPLDAGTLSLTWTSRGTRTGNGTLTVAPSAGYYYWYAAGTVSSSPANSVPVICPVTRSTRAILDRILDAVVAKLQTFTFPVVGSYPGSALPSTRIYRIDSFNEVALLKPKPFIGVATDKILFRSGTNQRDDIGQGFAVLLVDHGAPQNLVPFPTWQRWEEIISRGLRNQRLAGVSEVHFMEPRDYTPHSWSGPEGAKGYDVAYCAMPFSAVNRDPRGV